MHYRGKSISIQDLPVKDLYICDVNDATVTKSSVHIVGSDNWSLTATGFDGKCYQCEYTSDDEEHLSGTCELGLYEAQDKKIVFFGPWRDRNRSGQWLIELTPAV